MTLSLSKLCRKTLKHLPSRSRFDYKLFCTVGNRESTVLIFFTTHLLAAKPEARCEFPLLSQCQPGLSPHSASLPPSPSQLKPSSRSSRRCKPTVKLHSLAAGTEMHPVTHIKYTHKNHVVYLSWHRQCVCV